MPTRAQLAGIARRATEEQQPDLVDQASGTTTTKPKRAAAKKAPAKKPAGKRPR